MLARVDRTELGRGRQWTRAGAESERGSRTDDEDVSMLGGEQVECQKKKSRRAE